MIANRKCPIGKTKVLLALIYTNFCPLGTDALTTCRPRPAFTLVDIKKFTQTALISDFWSQSVVFIQTRRRLNRITRWQTPSRSIPKTSRCNGGEVYRTMSCGFSFLPDNSAKSLWVHALMSCFRKQAGLVPPNTCPTFFDRAQFFSGRAVMIFGTLRSSSIG